MKSICTTWTSLLPNQQGVLYVMGDSAQEVWSKVENEELMGTGMTAKMLRARGYRAKKVTIYLGVVK